MTKRSIANPDPSDLTGTLISVYGYGQYTSYWYPGGLDLNHL